MKTYIFGVTSLLLLASCSTLSDRSVKREVASTRKLEDTSHHTFYTGSSLKTATYRLNALGMSTGSCKSTVKEKSKELKNKGFKVLDSDTSSCNDSSPSMQDSHTVTLIFD